MDLLGTDIVERITPMCMGCGKNSIIRAHWFQFVAWERGMLIQDAFPELNPAERELLKTGTHPECWDKMFSEEEETVKDCGD